MDNEVTTFEVTVPAFQTFTLIETVKEGDKDINLTLLSNSKPLASLLINESKTRQNSLIMRRKINSKSSVIFSLT